MPDAASDYLSRLQAALRTGDATEHTHRGALEALLRDLGAGLTVINEPRQRTDCGAPDVVIRRGQLPIGYVEAKDVGKDLDAIEKSEQLKRYRRALPNLALTDYLSFVHYVDGERRAHARLATWDGKKVSPTPKGPERALELLTDFLARSPEPIGTPRGLADAMARLTHLVRDIVMEAFRRGEASRTLTDLRGAFSKTLIPELARDDRTDEFVDMYAQTLAYGLFAARIHHYGPPETFTRAAAAHDIPRTNPLLRRLFETLTGADLDDEPHAGFVSDLVALLAHADMEAVLKDFGKRTRREDPIVHFYETFLKAYDPKLRVERGVYYTPAPVVDFIVRSVDQILQRDFGVAGGLADSEKIAFKKDGEAAEAHRVLILDPACGTGTFLYHVVDFVRQNFRRRKQGGMWSAYVGEHLLPRLFGFELLMAPYAVAHLKLGLQLAAQDMVAEEQASYEYGFDRDERLQVYLTNTLEEADRKIEGLFGPYRAISDEARAANTVKADKPIMVIIGNPPYAGHSSNDGPWIRGLVEDYKKGDPGLYKPGQAKWLHDDYVKFIRWAEWRISQTGYGIVAYITNNGYLDNPTFRRMRRHLTGTFDKACLLDLHGSTTKKEKAPDGSPDENVFDIQQGVAIALFVKLPVGQQDATEVLHADLYGSREAKYDWLLGNDVSTVDWRRLEPMKPSHLFIPLDRDLLPEYERGWSLPEIFDQNGNPAPGIVTTHDQFAISFTEQEAIEKVERLLATKSEAEARQHFRLCTQAQWSYDKAKRELEDGEWRGRLERILYRPFDNRFTVYDSNVAVHRRERVSNHMIAGDNLALCTARKIDIAQGWEHIFVSDQIIQHHTVSIKEVNYIFPLYLYPVDTGDLFEQAREEREPNLSSAFIAALEEATGWRFVPDGTGDLDETVGPEDVLHYAYAVFHSPTYRSRYAEFLRIDYPRLPLTSDTDLFRELTRLGAELVDLHLLRRVPDELRPGFPVGGSNVVEKGFPQYHPPQSDTPGRVYINKEQYFEGIDPETWDFRVGGYQVLDKWLKDRRGRELSYEDLEHYTKTAAALERTRGVMGEVDGAAGVGGLAVLKGQSRTGDTAIG